MTDFINDHPIAFYFFTSLSAFSYILAFVLLIHLFFTYYKISNLRFMLRLFFILLLAFSTVGSLLMLFTFI